jgi:hypothetical protein
LSWEDITEDEVEKLKAHLKISHPEYEREISGEDPDCFEIYTNQGQEFISFVKMLYTDSPNSYRVKASKSVAPIVEGLFGPPNSPPFVY